jgi:hypothetical protein
MCPNCKFSTRKDDLSGATYTVKTFSEHEECRMCLEPGTKRKCCGNYYCDECYYKNPLCKSCGTAINNAGIKQLLWGKASITSVLLGWTFAIFVILAILALIAVVSASEAQTPVGIYGYKCYGFFKQCDTKVCLEVPSDILNGVAPLKDLTEWKFCDLDTDVKLETAACVFDAQLYTLTNSHAGYDPCLKEYRKGVYIMEDDFEEWQSLNFSSNLMKSALWEDIFNGVASKRCGSGVNGITGKSKKALTFSGAGARFATTKVIK